MARIHALENSHSPGGRAAQFVAGHTKTLTQSRSPLLTGSRLPPSPGIVTSRGASSVVRQFEGTKTGTIEIQRRHTQLHTERC